jgi:hypothetical protein
MYLLLVLVASGCAGAPPIRRENFLNAERRPIAELAKEIGFTPEPEESTDEAVVGVAATLAVRTCFPNDAAFAKVWQRWVQVKRVDDMAIVSLQRERSLGRSRTTGRWRVVIEHSRHPCLDRMAVLLPPGTRFGGALNNLVSLMWWGRARPPREEGLRQVLLEMQVVQTLRARCFAEAPQGDVLLVWGATSVRVVDMRNGDTDESNACSKRFELTYPIDVAGRAVTPHPSLPYSVMSFSHAAYSIEGTRKAWELKD